MTSYTTKKTPGDTSWFVHDRFGMFIHFGLYSLPARHEWIKKKESITEEKYEKYFEHFNPDMFDAKELAKKAKAAGMKYAVLTTKHHEGFCLFDTKYTDYNVMNTPFGRDIVREYVDAFREEGLRIGLYYSLIDWHHPDFTIDFNHPRRNDENAHELNNGRDMKRYSEYMRNQLTELFSNYGDIDILWLDFSYKYEYDGWMGKGAEDWEIEKLFETVRELQPNVIIDNRGGVDQDFWTPEQYQVTEWPRHKETGEKVVWESCQTMSGSWGYFRDETTWKSPEMLIRMLINTVSLGGNLIMNVGPTARGYIDYRANDALKAYEDWMKYNSRSIYGCTMAEPEFVALNGYKYTQSQDGKRLYVHLFEYPFRYLELPGLAGKIEYAQFLHDGSEIIFTDNEVKSLADSYEKDLSGTTILEIPVIKPNVIVPVVELFLK